VEESENVTLLLVLYAAVEPSIDLDSLAVRSTRLVEQAGDACKFRRSCPSRVIISRAQSESSLHLVKPDIQHKWTVDMDLKASPSEAAPGRYLSRTDFFDMDMG